MQKTLRVFFLGQLLGLSTLKSILTRLGIKSNQQQKNYYKLCKKLSNRDLRVLFEQVLETIVRSKLIKLAKKHPSNWSREIVTAVIDDSVFRQWLTTQKGIEEFGACYDRFFSGQFGKVVYGCKIVTFGLSIDGVFYPMYFDYAPKGEKATEVAIKLVKQWDKFRRNLYKKQQVRLPEISMTCDSGYNNKELLMVCKSAFLRYISVPKKSHLLAIKGEKWKLKNYVEQMVQPLEQRWKKAEKQGYFQHRVRAYYCSKNVDIVLLFFRLKGSKKISIIYTTDLDIHAKTLRRHWFQRTYIEQFFRWLKHVLKIHHSITRTKQEFDLKLYRFAFVALHAQLLVRFVRKKNRRFAKHKMSFQILQRFLASNKKLLQLLRRHLLQDPKAVKPDK